MDNVIPLDRREQRLHAEPWYLQKDLIGASQYDTPTGEAPAADDDPDLWFEEIGERFTGECFFAGMVVARFLPQDTYIPAEYVLATITACLWWGKPMDVSWMQMDYEPLRGCEVPVQHHRKGAALMYVEDDDLHFGVLGGADADPVRIQIDCVTDISITGLVPDPESTRKGDLLAVDGEVRGLTVEEHCEAGHEHDLERCRRCRPALVALARRLHDEGQPHRESLCTICQQFNVHAGVSPYREHADVDPRSFAEPPVPLEDLVPELRGVQVDG